MNWLWIFIASFCGAALSALGMGGGGILLIYLTAYKEMDQLTAQGINLVFFIPIAVVALIFHTRNGLVKWKLTLPLVILGFIGVYFGSKLAMFIGSEVLSKLFGVFLLVIGLRELTARREKAEPEKRGDEKSR